MSEGTIQKYLFSSIHRFIETRYDAALNILVALAALLYGGLQRQIRTGIYNDDAVYVIAARDFWNTAVAHPLLGVKPDYPMPGLPLLLAPLTRFVAPHWVYLEWMSVAAILLSVFFLGKLSRIFLSVKQSFVVTALYAFNPIVARISGVVMPSAYYVLAVLFGFYLLTKAVDRPSVLKYVSLGAVLGWGSLIRPEGFLLLLSVVACIFLTPRLRRYSPAVLAPVGLWIIFFIAWFNTRSNGRTEFGPDLMALLAYWPHQLSSVFNVLLEFFRVFLLENWTMLQFVDHSFALNLMKLCAFVWIIGIIAGFRSLWNEPFPHRTVLMGIGFFFCSYLFAHLFWHVSLPRYFAPLLPFALLFFVQGVCAHWSSRKYFGPVTRVFLALLFASYSVENAYGLYQSFWSRPAIYRPPWPTLKWIRDNTDPASKIVSDISPVIDLYTGRQSVGADTEATNIELFLYVLAKQGFGYLVFREGVMVTPGVGSTQDPNLIMARYHRWTRLYPARFRCVFDDTLGKTKVFQVMEKSGFTAAFEIFIDAVKAFDEKKYGEAFDKVERALQLYPDLGCGQNLKGALFLMQNDSVNAERAFLRSAELLPDSANEMLNLATLYFRKAQYERAEEAVHKGWLISTMKGESDAFLDDVKKLRELWSVGRARLFLDSPHPSGFQEPI